MADKKNTGYYFYSFVNKNNCLSLTFPSFHNLTNTVLINNQELRSRTSNKNYHSLMREGGIKMPTILPMYAILHLRRNSKNLTSTISPTNSAMRELKQIAFRLLQYIFYSGL